MAMRTAICASVDTHPLIRNQTSDHRKPRTTTSVHPSQATISFCYSLRLKRSWYCSEQNADLQTRVRESAGQ